MPNSEIYLQTISYLESDPQPYLDPRLLITQLATGTITLAEYEEIYLSYIEINFNRIKVVIEENSTNSKKLTAIISTLKLMHYRQTLTKKQTETLKNIIESQIKSIQSKLST